jgi:hypothetical protein
MLLIAASASAATITVPTTADSSGSVCTLRDAIKAANFDSPQGACTAGSGTDLISITAVGTISLGSPLPQVESALAITGPGDMALVRLQGNGTSFRVLDINTPGDVRISNLTVADGFANGDGGGISHTGGGELTLDNVQITGNEAHVAVSSTPGFVQGGGVFNGSGSSLDIHDSLISLNTVSAVHTGAAGGATADGSAIASLGPLSMDGTSVVSNTTTVSSQNLTNGTGAVLATGQTQITNSGITGNSSTATTTGGVGNALLNGGGLEARPGSSDSFTLDNSTIGANTLTATGTASGLERGGGLDFNGQTDGLILSATIAQNSANFQGSNVHINALDHTLTFKNSIVAEKGGSGPNCASANGTFVSVGHNLEDDASPATNCNFTNPTDISGVDPVLGSPADNAGLTPTMAISATSPAVDQGDAGGDLTDQRGDARPRDLNAVANASGGDGSDIGAYEFQSTEPSAAAIDFGPVLRGHASTTQAVTVTNRTGSSLTAGPASLLGSDAADFSIAADNCNVTLTSLASCTVDLRFTPRAVTSTGSKTAELRASDDVSAEPYGVALTGTATTPPPPPPPDTSQPTPPTSAPPAAKKKCKKGRKLKKGKCVKRKKKH